jgi:hypothetical protein
MKKLLFLLLIITGILTSSNVFASSNQFTIDDYCSVSNNFYTTFIPKVMNKTFTEENSVKVKRYVNTVVETKNFTSQDGTMSDPEASLDYLVMKVYPKFQSDIFIQLLSLDTSASFKFYGNVGIGGIRDFVYQLNSKYEPDNLIKILNSHCKDIEQNLTKSGLSKEQITKTINSDPDFNLKQEYQYMKRMLLQNKKWLLKDAYFKRMNEKVVKYFVMKEIEQIVREFMEKNTPETMDLWAQYLTGEG